MKEKGLDEIIRGMIAHSIESWECIVFVAAALLFVFLVIYPTVRSARQLAALRRSEKRRKHRHDLFGW